MLPVQIIPTRIGQVCGEYMFMGVMPYKSTVYALFQGNSTTAKKSRSTNPTFNSAPRLPIAPTITPVVATGNEQLAIAHQQRVLRDLNGNCKQQTLVEITTGDVIKYSKSYGLLCSFRTKKESVVVSLNIDPVWKRPHQVGVVLHSRLLKPNVPAVGLLETNSSGQVHIARVFAEQIDYYPTVKVPLL